MSIAKLLERRSHIVPGKFNVSELFFEVPRDHSNPGGDSLRLFARSIKKSERPADDPSDGEHKDLPWFLYLQGGPGFECRSPQSYPYTRTILDKGYQMLFLDQRGTGLSSPISTATLGRQGSSQNQAQYLRSFRADSIVRDCEAIRKCLTADYPETKQKWSIMGQSFGGFCAVTYLSLFPQGLKEVFMCGGLPPLVNSPDEVYEKTYKKVIQRNHAYYEKYPEDIPRVNRICRYLNESEVLLPSGGFLTARRFMQLGLVFGFHGGIDGVHEIVLKAATEIEQLDLLNRSSLATIDSNLHFDENILYAVLHEAIYCQGASSRWSAHRIRLQFEEFEGLGDIGSEAKISKERQTCFTGEMIYPWMFADYSELRPLEKTANLIAEMDDWPALYDESQLAKNEVPVYAATYIDDMYVDFDLARETASKIKGCKEFITNVMYHNALSSKSDEVMRQLFALRDDVVD